LIGKGGKMLKSIGSEARKQIERLLGIPIYLALHVRVVSSWSEKAGTLTEMGYPEP
ncbi:MAG: KH domain-containing protein, partial [SAR324 cluster bacterium]|nr:KH domain-containing protein [SAR324 cluster bacterium]